MKEELEKLGFKEGLNMFWFKLNNGSMINILNKNEVWLNNVDEMNFLYLFDYNHEKLKQLINILS